MDTLEDDPKFIQDLPKILGLDCFKLSRYCNDNEGSVYILYSEPVTIPFITNYEQMNNKPALVDLISTHILKVIEDAPFLKTIRKDYEDKLKALEKQVLDLQKYKTHYNMEMNLNQGETKE